MFGLRPARTGNAPVHVSFPRCIWYNGDYRSCLHSSWFPPGPKRHCFLQGFTSNEISPFKELTEIKPYWDIPSPFELHFSLFFRIIDHIQTPRPTTITNIRIPPNHGLCILSLLLSYLETFPMFTSALDRLISSWPYVSAKSDRQPNIPSPPPRLVRSIVSPFVFFLSLSLRIFKHP